MTTAPVAIGLDGQLLGARVRTPLAMKLFHEDMAIG